MNIVDVCLKWMHMARYGLTLKFTLKQDNTIRLRIISKPLLTQKWPIEIKNYPKITKLVGVALE